MTKYVEKYINKFDMYQRIKNCIEALVRKLITNEVLERPWIYLIVDFITKLPLVARNNVILVVCSRLSKMAYFVAIIKETLVEISTVVQK